MCVLRVSGPRFDPDAFLAGSSWEPTRVFHRGEPSRWGRSKGKPLDASGFVVAVSDRPWSDLPGQIEDSVAFLRRHRTALLQLANDATVDDVRLDFPMNLRVDGDKIAAQFDYLPPVLVAEAGALKMGIELSLYPPTWDDGEGMTGS